MKNKFTELNVTIITDDEHKTGDNLEMTRQRIERAAIYLMSVFNLLRVAALANEGQAETREMRIYFESAINASDIGYGLADSILASATCLTEFQPDGKATPEKAFSAGDDSEKYTGDIEIDNLALAISGLMNNPNLPPPLRTGFDKALIEFFNSQLGDDEFNDDLTSGEYIARHLKVYNGGEKQ